MKPAPFTETFEYKANETGDYMNLNKSKPIHTGDHQEDWRFILDFLPDAVMLHDGEKILHANHAACRFMECETPDALIDTPYLDRIHPEDHNLLVSRISEVFHGNPSSLREYRIVDLKGGIKDVEAKATRIYYDVMPVNLVIFRDITQRKAQQKELLALNAQLVRMQERQTTFARNLINNEEKLRSNLAMELHDRIGQPLTSIKMDLERLLHTSEHANTGENARLERYIESLRRSILDLKRMSSELLPSIIANLGLDHSLRSLRDKVAERTGMDVCLFTSGLSVHYSEDVEVAIYRVIQEALNNAVKHAKASRCFVNLLDDEHSLSLSIEDDGIGFDVSKKSLTDSGNFSLGLHIMRERVEFLGGEFTIESEPDKGTGIVAIIPMDDSMRRRNQPASGNEGTTA